MQEKQSLDNKNHKLVNRSKTSKRYSQNVGDDYVNDITSITSTTTNLETDSEEISEDSSICRHCLRPQSELQLRYLEQRQQQRQRCRQKQQQNQRKNSKHRQQQNRQARGHNRSKNRKDARQATVQILPTRRIDLNAANEEAIRFRCPQVGPQFGRDAHLPPMHFHHPQLQQQIAYQQQLQLQQYQYTHPYTYAHTHAHAHAHAHAHTHTHTTDQHYQHHQQHKKHAHNVQQQQSGEQHCTIITIECEQQLKEQHNQNMNQNISPTITATATNNRQCCAHTLRTAASTANSSHSSRYVSPMHIGTNDIAKDIRQQQQHVAQLPLAQSATASSDVAAIITTTTATTIAIEQDPEQQRPEREPTTPDSPSLVKVRTWYTVAKQGVSC